MQQRASNLVPVVLLRNPVARRHRRPVVARRVVRPVVQPIHVAAATRPHGNRSLRTSEMIFPFVRRCPLRWTPLQRYCNPRSSNRDRRRLNCPVFLLSACMRSWVSGSTNASPATRSFCVALMLSFVLSTQRGFDPQRGKSNVYVFENFWRAGHYCRRGIFDDSDICRQSRQRAGCSVLLWQGL